MKWQNCGAHPCIPNATVFKKASLVAVLERHKDGLLHLSLSAHKRNPAYQEVKEARYELMPDAKYVAQIFPPQDEFVNIHEGCFHLWELAPEEAPPT